MVEKPPEPMRHLKNPKSTGTRHVCSIRSCIKKLLPVALLVSAVTLIAGHTIYKCSDGSPNCTNDIPSSQVRTISNICSHSYTYVVVGGDESSFND